MTTLCVTRSDRNFGLILLEKEAKMREAGALY